MTAALNKLRYEAGKLLDDAGTEAPISLANGHFASLKAAAESLADAGLGPRDKRLAEALTPLRERLPEDANAADFGTYLAATLLAPAVPRDEA